MGERGATAEGGGQRLERRRAEYTRRLTEDSYRDNAHMIGEKNIRDVRSRTLSMAFVSKLKAKRRATLEEGAAAEAAAGEAAAAAAPAGES